MINKAIAKTYLTSLNESLHAMMEADGRVLLIGEDILDPYGGAFKVSKGLSSRFPSQVLTTPISESAIVGLGTGLAMRGFLPVIEIMFGDFITLAADQLINHAAKFRWMYNEKVRVPLVVRAPMGAYRSYGPTHSQSLEKHFLGIPGLWVVSPNIFTQPGEMLRQALMQLQEPVLFVEHKYAYAQPLIDAPEGMTMEVMAPDQGFFQTTLLCHRNPDPSLRGLLLCYGGLSKMCLEASLLLRHEEGICMDLAVISQLSPSPITQLQMLFDRYKDTLFVYVEEASVAAGWGCEMMAVMQDFAMDENNCHLKQVRIGSQFSVIPSSKQLEGKILPNVRGIINQVLACF
jgi:pyruvate/2-oxoglutarate/acetoin dehydrogenase E1 component